MCCMLLCFMQLTNGHVMVGGWVGSIVLILAGYEDSMFNHILKCGPFWREAGGQDHPQCLT